MESCDNCYYKTGNTKICSWDKVIPIENICDRHCFNCIECGRDIVTHRFKEKVLCADCLLKEIGVEKREVSKQRYYYDGDCLGDSDLNDIDEIIDKMRDYGFKFETLEED